MTKVLICGDGVAASCCERLLAQAGLSILFEPVDRPRLPAVMLGDRALALIRDVFGNDDLFEDAPRVNRRVVAWGTDARTIAVEHSAVVVSEEKLLRDLRGGAVADAGSSAAPGWTIFASRPLPEPNVEHSFGTRIASSAPVTLRAASQPGTCWIESLESGWLFLIPDAPGSAWLLAVGAAPDTLLAQSRVVANEIDTIQPAKGRFPAYPRIVWPLAADGWIACGTAAMAFDPLCGDGTAHAIREAILASAVVRAVAEGRQRPAVLAHYQARLTAGFRRHLELCHGYYESGGSGPWWQTELGAIREGIAWCDSQLRDHGAFRYQLRDFELHALA